MHLVDTHCHIHEDSYPLDVVAVINDAKEAGVRKLIAVGTTAATSQEAANLASEHENIWFSIGQHPHEAKDFGQAEKQIMQDLAGKDKLVAVGEIGLDYWYAHSTVSQQESALRWQLDLATQHNLPVIFHNRGSKDKPQDAFDDLWKILEDYPKIRGVVHSFSANEHILDQIMQRNLAVGINGIMSFTKDTQQLQALDLVPIDRIVLETDAPYLTPPPFRGSINEPKHLVEVAKFVAERKGISLGDLADITSDTVRKIFNI